MNTELASLEAAAERACTGDTAAFQIIVDATSGRLVRFGARLLGTVEEAEDVVQEGYVKAYLALRSGRFDGRSSIVTWLHRIVTNCSIDALRRRRRRDAHQEVEGLLFEGGVESAETRVVLGELDRSLRGLSAEQRVVMILRAVEGYSSKEVAEILDITEGAVEQRLIRARLLLKERIQ